MAQSSRVFFDANVLLDAVLEREHFVVAVDTLRKASGRAHISALTGHLVVYFGSKELDIDVLRGFLADFIILPLEATDFEWAFTNIRSSDFEDALQLAVAIRHGCSEFVTLDKGLIKTYQSLPNIRLRLA